MAITQIAVGMTGGLMDALVLSITGIVVVLLALLILSMVVSLFKSIDPQKGKVTATETAPKNQPKKPEEVSVSNEITLDEHQTTAVLAAVTLELKLYHETEPAELTFDYRPRPISAWSMAGISKD